MRLSASLEIAQSQPPMSGEHIQTRVTLYYMRLEQKLCSQTRQQHLTYKPSVDTQASNLYF